jgi:hypothetical protein
MSEKTIIKNQAKFQVFLTLYSSAIVGCASRKQDPQINIHEQARKIAKSADAVAEAAFKEFEGHLPDVGMAPSPEEGKNSVIELPTK